MCYRQTRGAGLIDYRQAGLALVGRGFVVGIGHILSRGCRIGFRHHAARVVVSAVGDNTATIGLLGDKPPGIPCVIHRRTCIG